jgi:hypothetical protein
MSFDWNAQRVKLAKEIDAGLERLCDEKVGNIEIYLETEDGGSGDEMAFTVGELIELFADDDEWSGKNFQEKYGEPGTWPEVIHAHVRRVCETKFDEAIDTMDGSKH